MNEYFERMREDLPRHDNLKVRGLSTEGIVAKHYAASELESLVASLRERPLPSMPPFELFAFIWERQPHRIPEELRCESADNVASLVAAGGTDLQEAAVQIFLAWGRHRSDYPAVCRSLLRHPDSEVRMAALSYAASFLDAADLPTLFEFRSDRSFGESEGMGGPLRYYVRDHALAVLQWLTDAPKSGEDCFENTANGRVFYRSWSPFLNWYEQNKVKIRHFRPASSSR